MEFDGEHEGHKKEEPRSIKERVKENHLRQLRRIVEGHPSSSRADQPAWRIPADKPAGSQHAIQFSKDYQGYLSEKKFDKPESLQASPKTKDVAKRKPRIQQIREDEDRAREQRLNDPSHPAYPFHEGYHKLNEEEEAKYYTTLHDRWIRDCHDIARKRQESITSDEHERHARSLAGRYDQRPLEQRYRSVGIDERSGSFRRSRGDSSERGRDDMNWKDRRGGQPGRSAGPNEERIRKDKKDDRKGKTWFSR